MTKENGQIYENIQVIVPEAEYKYWSDPAVIEKLPEGGRADRPARPGDDAFVEKPEAGGDGCRGGGGRTSPVATHGHSPGHTSYHVSAGSGQLMVLGDVTNSQAINIANPGWHIMFDQDPQWPKQPAAPLSTGDRRQDHMHGLPLGYARSRHHPKDGGGYVLVPVA